MTMIFPINQIKNCRVLIVGDIMLERSWFAETNRLSLETPISILHLANKEDRLGGAANVAKNVVSLGSSATLIGIAGYDETCDTIKKLLIQYKIPSHIVMCNSNITTLKMCVLDNQQQLLRMDFENQPGKSALDNICDIFFQKIVNHDIVIFSDYSKGTLNRIDEMIKFANEHNIPVFINTKGDSYAKYTGSNFILTNLSEIKQIIGEWSNEEQLNIKSQKLRKELSLDALLITQYEYGMTLFNDDGIINRDADCDHELTDIYSSADIDAIIAVLSLCRISGLNWHDSMYWASKARDIVFG